MDFGKYDIGIRNLVGHIEQRTYHNQEEQMELCQKLFDISQKMEDDELSGFACYCFGEAYFEYREAERGFFYFSKGINYLSHTQESEILCRSYNKLALLLQYQGNFINAMDCFFTGIEIAEENHLDILAGILYQNFSALCEIIGDYDRALFYRKQSQECLGRCEKSSESADYELSVKAMLLRLYLKLNRLDDASRIVDEIHIMLEKNPKRADALEILVCKLEFAQITGMKDEEQILREKTVQAFYECSNIVQYFDECLMLSAYLRSIKDLPLLESVLNRIEDVVGSSDYTELYMQVIQYRIGMYEILGRKKELSDAAYMYFKLSCRQKEEMKRSVSSVINVKLSLKQAEVSNIFLSAKADMDALTGIFNRRKLNEEADRLFEKAKRGKRQFGVEMLDIDNFKKYNDDYGHHLGDQCIIKLADALRESNGAHQVCARYGGDEFFIIYYGLSDEEIIKRCRKLREKVACIGTGLGLQSFTVSQGVANWVPKEENRVWDYTSTADEALYWIKKKGRDDIRLIHSVKELED